MFIKVIFLYRSYKSIIAVISEENRAEFEQFIVCFVSLILTILCQIVDNNRKAR